MVMKFWITNMTVVREESILFQAMPWEIWRCTVILATLCMVSGVTLHHSAVDHEWLIWGHRQVWLPDQFWLFVTQWGDAGQSLILLMVIFFDRCVDLALVFKTWLMGIPASVLLKAIDNSARPLSVLESELLNIVGQPPMLGHSMPSGHAMTAGAMAALLFFGFHQKRPWLSMLMLLACGLVALSRLSVGAHWPGDVLTGLGLGWLLVMLAQQWERVQPWATRLTSARSQALIIWLQVFLLVLTWMQPSEGLGMILARMTITAWVLTSVASKWQRQLA